MIGQNLSRNTVVSVGAFLILLAVPCVLIWQARRQNASDQELIRAVRQNDLESVVAALRSGADPNCHDNEPTPSSFIEFVRDRFNGNKNESVLSNPVLSIACSLNPCCEKDGVCYVGVILFQPMRVDDSKVGSPHNQSVVHNAPVPSVPASPKLEADTPYYGATSLADIKIIRALLEAGAIPNAVDSEGSTPLLVAAKWYPKATSQLLLEFYADVNARNKEGDSALITVAKYYDSSEMKLLLQYGAEIDASNIDGETPLMLASEAELDDLGQDTLRELLEHHADFHKMDKHGFTALAHAKQAHNPSAIRLLQQAGAKL